MVSEDSVVEKGKNCRNGVFYHVMREYFWEIQERATNGARMGCIILEVMEMYTKHMSAKGKKEWEKVKKEQKDTLYAELEEEWYTIFLNLLWEKSVSRIKKLEQEREEGRKELTRVYASILRKDEITYEEKEFKQRYKKEFCGLASTYLEELSTVVQE